jgi:hypothetical protein
MKVLCIDDKPEIPERSIIEGESYIVFSTRKADLTAYPFAVADELQILATRGMFKGMKIWHPKYRFREITAPAAPDASAP